MQANQFSIGLERPHRVLQRDFSGEAHPEHGFRGQLPVGSSPHNVDPLLNGGYGVALSKEQIRPSHAEMQ